MNNIVVDIETRINKELVRDVIFEGKDISSEDAYLEYKQTLLDQSNGKSDFFPIIFHEPIVIGYAICADYKITRTGWMSGSDVDVGKFWEAVNRGNRVITWGGRAFDMPVLELAGIRLGIPAPDYYGAKFGARYRYSDDGHLDIFEVVTNNGATAFRGGLNAISKMVGFPGKTGAVRGNEVQKAYEDGRIEEIARYCMGDVLITYGVWCHVDYVRGKLTEKEYSKYRQECLERIDALG